MPSWHLKRSQVIVPPAALESPAPESTDRPGLEHHRRGLPIAVAAGLLVVCWVTDVALHIDQVPDGNTSPAASRAAPSRSATPGGPTAQPAVPLEVLRTSPEPGTKGVGFASAITVQFSTPLAASTADPTLSPKVPGSWDLVRPTVLVFRPAGYFVPFSKLVLTVPAGLAGPRGARGQSLRSTYEASFTVAGGSMLRVQQLLAELGYLPLGFDPSAPAPSEKTPRPLPGVIGLGGSVTSTARALATSGGSRAPGIDDESTDPDDVSPSPQPGTFSWRYPHIPASLDSSWQPGVDTVLVQGAVMAFESEHGLADAAVLTTAFWTDLVDAVAQRQVTTSPYDYIEVSTALPETLSVWRDGSVIFESPTNTGIPEAPTEVGTFPVYARYFSTTMSGHNPDGSAYDDPGIPDVAYFNGGDAVHGFLRGSYGFPQSLGCVELPYAAAAVVFNYDPIGTLVNIG